LTVFYLHLPFRKLEQLSQMSWWDVNFAAGASVGAGFAPGSFQQGGWALALVVTGALFVCSMLSFAAYTSLTSVVYWAQQLRARGHVAGSDHAPLPAVTAASPFRAAESFRALSWSQTPLDLSNKKAAKKRKGKQQLEASPNSLYVVPESSLLVHFFTGSELFTRLFEACQFVFWLSALILKTATAVDIMYTFMLASPYVHRAMDASLVVSALATPTGMSAVVFLVMALCLLVPPVLNASLVRAADTCMMMIQLLLVCFLTNIAVTVEWSREGPKATHGAFAATLPQDATHLSALFPLSKRFFFVTAAAASLFIPHAGTPAIFRGPPSNLATLPARALHQFRASSSSVVYYVVLGVVYDIVLPLGRTTPRAALLNFVDYRKWLVDADAYEWIMIMFVLAPLVHLVSVTRGMLENLLSTSLRIIAAPPGRVPPSRRPVLLLALAAIVGWMSLHFRPLYYLVLCACLLHATYLALYLNVWWRRWQRKGKAGHRTISLASHLLSLPEPGKAGLLWAPTLPQSVTWWSGIAATVFWAVITVYWVNAF
jgi:hypothetical protein